MKNLFQPAVILMFVVAGLTACKKDSMPSGNSTITTPEIEAGGFINANMARKLVKKGTDSLVYNAGGSLSKVIYNPFKYVSYQKTGNILTASTFENNVLRLKVEYTINNGRTTQSKHTSYESTVGVSKTWLYDYDNHNRLSQQYNKDNFTERINYYWVYPGNLGLIRWYSGANQEIASLQFGHNNTQVDKLKINSARSGLDPYLNIFGASNATMVTAENMNYALSPGSNFNEVFTYTYDRDGFPVKVDVYDPTNWTFKYAQTFSYKN